MGIPGEDLEGFYVASDFLYKANLQNSEIKPLIADKKYEDLFKMIHDENDGIKAKLKYYYGVFHTGK